MPIYGWFEKYETCARQLSLHALELQPGMHLLQIGSATGQVQSYLEQVAGPQGLACGMDISPAMLTRTRRQFSGTLFRGDARFLPHPAGSFDRLYSAYVLDLSHRQICWLCCKNSTAFSVEKAGWCCSQLRKALTTPANWQ
jgi:ubiquinone/menaquinone biosynthesis C-methylase UbiE